jgi:hypothetical protein
VGAVVTVTVTDAELDPLSNILADTVEKLATCLCAQLLAAGTPKCCFCGLVAGTEVPLDLATMNGGNKTCGKGNGFAFIRLGGTYPSTEVGVADITPGNCAKGEGVDLEIGVFRCYPLSRDGKNPPPDQMLDATRLQYADERTMRKAISCCSWLDPEDFVVGTYQPVGPEGGILGGVIPISAML